MCDDTSPFDRLTKYLDAEVSRLRSEAARRTKAGDGLSTPKGRLDAILDTETPKLARKLAGSWVSSKGVDITQREIEDAIAYGDVPPEWRERFRQRYSAFVADELNPAWGLAYNAGGFAVFTTTAQLAAATSFDGLVIPLAIQMDLWASTRAATLVTGLTDEQTKAMRTILRIHGVQNPLAPRELGILMRSVVGLDAVQAQALARRREQAFEDGIRGARLDKYVERQRSQMIRARAYRIARTELATAYNEGTRGAVKTAFADSPQRLSEIRAVWQTGEDERVCFVCGPLNGVTVGLDDTFVARTRIKTPVTKLVRTPPAHPNCRCTLLYVFPEDEVELPSDFFGRLAQGT